MNFREIKPINQIQTNLFVRHMSNGKMEEGDLIQRCEHCGQVLQDNTGFIFFTEDKERNRAYGEGYVYINKSGNTQMTIVQYAINLGFFSTPKEFIDCTIINS